ncbi:MAG: tRNA (adenosine(37)-N6)-threonylcarbamoyltransferase complex dimerization subunit type 1 TsaB [Deltaproteobacteria bacterium]|nr:tRNA (adenosine(37)-N6)-threonylcarbamoyltransferase complex dimerization subunit type 1 TsaB [Deltaproteobacteria bacterium]
MATDYWPRSLLILALDTATDRGSLALMEEDRLLGEYLLAAPGSFLQHLLPGLETLLQDTGRRLEDVGAIAVSQGPGNFTGLRLGLATAKGLAWSLRVPLVAVPTLEVLAAQCALQPRPVAVIIDAKRREVYLGRFLGAEAEPRALEPPVRLPLAELPGRLTPPLLLTGPALDTYEDFLEDFLRDKLHPDIRLAPPEARHPRAATLARLARQRLQAGQTVSPSQLVPLYLRPAL